MAFARHAALSKRYLAPGGWDADKTLVALFMGTGGARLGGARSRGTGLLQDGRISVRARRLRRCGGLQWRWKARSGDGRVPGDLHPAGEWRWDLSPGGGLPGANLPQSYR